MNPVPDHWEMSSLGAIANDISYGFTTTSNIGGNGAKLLRITDIQDGKVNWSTVPHCTDLPRATYLLRSGDIVIARTGATTGKSYLIEELSGDVVYASYLIRLRVNDLVEPKYLWSFLQSNDYWSQIQMVSKGTAQPGANATILSQVRVPIAPVHEQRRIVAKIDSLFAKSDRVRHHLDHLPRLAEKYKQAVLGVAFRGNLPGISPSPAVELSTLVSLRTGPFGSALHKSDYGNDGVPLVNPMHIVDGRIVCSEEMSVSKAKALELSEFRLREGDVVLARRGVMGRCAVVSRAEVGFLCGTGSIIVRPRERLLPGYLQRFLSSPDVVASLLIDAVGTTMVNLNQSILLRLQIPLPAISDQKEIVCKIESAFVWIDRLSSDAGGARKLIDHLDQAVLSKAFRGELVPQDPSDEPANVLLERIRAERATPQRIPGPSSGRGRQRRG